MFKKTKLVINCDICDARKLNEEDYSCYEEIMINADIIIISEKSKSIFNRLPIEANYDNEIALPDDADTPTLKTANGPYKITRQTVQTDTDENIILVANGPLTIETGTEAVLKKYLRIVANGPVKYPQSLEICLDKMTINGPVSTYPDDHVLLGHNFIIDKYFLFRARENGRYYVDNTVIIPDMSVDTAALADKICFAAKKAVLPEKAVSDASKMFDESTPFVVVPDGMKLICGDSVLNQRLITINGGNLFIFGNLEVDKDADIEALMPQIQRLIVKGTVSLRANQEEAFYKLNAEFDKLEIIRDCRRFCNTVRVYLDKTIFDNSPNGIEVCNSAEVVIAEDVTPEMILDKLSISNCARVKCGSEQESSVAAVATNVAGIGNSADNGGSGQESSVAAVTTNAADIGNLADNDGMTGALKDLAHTKVINADSYIM